jgi:hypothetical protein
MVEWQNSPSAKILSSSDGIWLASTMNKTGRNVPLPSGLPVHALPSLLRLVYTRCVVSMIWKCRSSGYLRLRRGLWSRWNRATFVITRWWVDLPTFGRPSQLQNRLYNLTSFSCEFYQYKIAQA